MKHTKIPQTNSLQELAQFWDTHDLTDFEDELEEVMAGDIFEKYLKECYEDQVGWYEKKSSQNKRCYQWFQWGAIVISASVPALVVLMPDRLKWIAFIVSIVLAVITIVLKTAKFEEN